MDFPAAPRPGRRVSLAAPVVLVGALLLAPPLFLLAPFVVLTLLSRPRTLRELFWLVAAGIAVGLLLEGPSGIAADLIRASGLVLAAVFAFLSLRTRVALFGRALLAVLVTALSIVIWEAAHGVGWGEVQQAFTAMLRDSYGALLRPRGPAGAPPSPELRALVQPFIDAAPELARKVPGLLALQGLAGVALAWLWHHRIAATPLGQPAAPFRLFRFNDHFVWGAIFTLALLLAPLPEEGKALAESLLVLWIGLYAMRGLAIASAVLAPAPAPLRVLVAALALLLSPLALGVCVALGLADTWVDIRRRLTPPASGGA